MPKWTSRPGRSFERPATPAGGAGQPVGPASGARPKAPVPVSPEEFDKRTHRRRLILGGLAAAAVLAAGGAYFAYTRSRLAVESLDAGTQKLQRGLYVEAARELDRAISLQPSNAQGYFLRGQAYMGVLDAVRAIPDFNRAIELDPVQPEYLAARAKALLDRKDFTRAISDLTRAIELQPTMAEAHLRRGVAQREAGQLARAVTDFTRAIELAPTADAYVQRAMTRQQSGDHPGAISDFTRAIEFAPDNPHNYYARGRSRAAVGDAAGARADREFAKSRDSR